MRKETVPASDCEERSSLVSSQSLVSAEPQGSVMILKYRPDVISAQPVFLSEIVGNAITKARDSVAAGTEPNRAV